MRLKLWRRAKKVISGYSSRGWGQSPRSQPFLIAGQRTGRAGSEQWTVARKTTRAPSDKKPARAVCAIIWIEGTSWRIPQLCAGSNPSHRHLAPAVPRPACAPKIGSCSSGSIPGWPPPTIVARSGGSDLKMTSAASARPSGLPKRDDELLTRH